MPAPLSASWRFLALLSASLSVFVRLGAAGQCVSASSRLVQRDAGVRDKG